MGYELAAEAQRDFTPEDAAARLRSVPDVPVPGRSRGPCRHRTLGPVKSLRPARAHVSGGGPPHGHPPPGHHPHPVRGNTRRPAHGPGGEQLPQLEHPRADGHRRELLRDHGRGRDLRDHLRRHRPLRRLRLRAGGGDHGPRPARPGAVLGRGDRPHRPRHLRGRRPRLRGPERGDGGGPARAPVHHHPGHDVDPARAGLRDQPRGEHPGARAPDRDGQGLARPHRDPLPGADAR